MINIAQGQALLSPSVLLGIKGRKGWVQRGELICLLIPFFEMVEMMGSQRLGWGAGGQGVVC